MHTDVPVISALYRPARHAEHTDGVDAVTTPPYMPALHGTQAGPAVLMAPPRLYEPAIHARQELKPAARPYPPVQFCAVLAATRAQEVWEMCE